MSLILYHRKNNPVQVRKLKRCMEELLRYSGRGRAYLEINLVGLDRIYQLNKSYRKKSKITDVLSFPQDVKPLSPKAPWHLGEIFIATEVAKRQARRARRTLTQQVVRLAVHGFVHLHGLDHEKGTQEERGFEKLERKYLGYLKKKGLMPWDGSLQF